MNTLWHVDIVRQRPTSIITSLLAADVAVSSETNHVISDEDRVASDAVSDSVDHSSQDENTDSQYSVTFVCVMIWLKPGYFQWCHEQEWEWLKTID